MKIWNWVLILVAAAAGVLIGKVVLGGSSNMAAEELQSRIVTLEEAKQKQAQKEYETQKLIENLQFKISSLEARASAPLSSSIQPSAVSTPNSEISSGATSDASAAHRSAVPMPDSGTGYTEPTPAFRSWVQRVIADQKAEDAAKERAAAEQRRVERVSRRVDRAAEELQLNNFQKDEVKKILIEEESARSKIFEGFRDMEPGQDRDLIAQSFTEIRTSRDDKLRLILSPDQMEKAQGSLLSGGFGPGGGGAGGFFQRNQNRENANPRPNRQN